MDDCIFCRIVAKELPSRTVFEDDRVIVIEDIDPQAPVHLLIIPTQHFSSILNVPAGSDVINHIHLVASKLAIRLEAADKGFRLLTNVGEDGGQSVGHLHYHFLAGRHMGWPPG